MPRIERTRPANMAIMLSCGAALICLVACVSQVLTMPYNNDANQLPSNLFATEELANLAQPTQLARDDDDDDDDSDANERNARAQDQIIPQDTIGLPATIDTDPMRTSASHHHHKKYVKGMLDMGAWTKKKGAFGWYADFPVGGKGKK